MNVTTGTNWKISPLGEIEDWVYDIEVEDDHNFFANDILVHNSNYLNMGPFVDKYLKDKSDTQITNALSSFFAQKVEPFMAKSYQEMCDYFNNKEQLMIMDREVIADRGIFVAPKMYYLRVIDSEGIRYDSPKLKIMGLRVIKSNTPEFCRKTLKDMLPQILDSTNNDLIDRIEKFKTELWYNSKPSEIAISMSVSNVDKYKNGQSYIKGTPQQSRAAILYNIRRKAMNLEEEPEIRNGDKVKIVYLKLPNPINENVIGFVNELPDKFGLRKYIDYELMFQKAFIDPLESVLKAVNWQTEKTFTLF